MDAPRKEGKTAPVIIRDKDGLEIVEGKDGVQYVKGADGELVVRRHTIKRPSDIGAIWEDSEDDMVAVADEEHSGIWCAELTPQRKNQLSDDSGSEHDAENQLSAYEASLPNWQLHHYQDRLVMFPLNLRSICTSLNRIHLPGAFPIGGSC